MDLKIAILAGDGIGPEVTNQAIKILRAIGEVYDHDFVFEEALVGAEAMEKTGNPLPKQTLNLCKNTDAVILGAVGDPKIDSDAEAQVRPEQGLLDLRRELGLFVNTRPIKTYKELLKASPLKKEIIEGVDFVILRELNSGLNFGEKKCDEIEAMAMDSCEYSEEEIDRVANIAFQVALTRKKKVTLVDKANVMETSRLWRKVVKRIGEGYPDVTLDFLLVDNAAMQIVLNPKQFDVILTQDIFGDILSDEASVISGSIGLLGSVSIGEKHALFRPVHGSFPQAKGKNIANPIGSILSAAMLLEHFGLFEESKKVVEGVNKAFEYNVVTTDLNADSKFGTNEVGEFISNFILNKDDLMYFNDDNVNLGQSTIV